jgi:hypothetical protein
MGKGTLIDTQIVDDFTQIHPALYYLDDMAYVSIKCQIQETYLDNEIKRYKLRDGFYTVTNNNERFVYSTEELTKRKLYYSGKLDILQKRWNKDDVIEFCKTKKSLTIQEIFQIVRNEFYFYMIIDDVRVFDLLACFVIYTYFHPLFNYASIIHLWGHAGTGKTKICSLLDAMCFNPVNSANISAATLYRIIEGSKATVILDESEDLMGTDKGKEIVNMLLAGIGKSGEVYRQEKNANENFSTATFKIFSPKVIANIRGIEIPSILTRVIRIITTGSKDRDKIILNRTVESESMAWENNRNQLYRMALTRFKEVIETKASLPEHELSGRTFNIWEGILTIAHICGEDIYKSLVQYAKENEEIIKIDIDVQADDMNEVKEKLKNLCNGVDTYKATADELLSLLRNEYGSISKKELHTRMERMGLRTKVGRLDGKVVRFYEIFKEKL